VIPEELAATIGGEEHGIEIFTKSNSSVWASSKAIRTAGEDRNQTHEVVN